MLKMESVKIRALRRRCQAKACDLSVTHTRSTHELPAGRKSSKCVHIEFSEINVEEEHDNKS